MGRFHGRFYRFNFISSGAKPAAAGGGGARGTGQLDLLCRAGGLEEDLNFSPGLFDILHLETTDLITVLLCSINSMNIHLKFILK